MSRRTRTRSPRPRRAPPRGTLPRAANAGEVAAPGSVLSGDDAERTPHEGVDATEVRVRPGCEVGRGREGDGSDRGWTAVTELTGVEQHVGVRERIGDSRRTVAGERTCTLYTS